MVHRILSEETISMLPGIGYLIQLLLYLPTGCCSELDIFVSNLIYGFGGLFWDVRGEGGSGLFLTFWRSLGESPSEQDVFKKTRVCSKSSGKIVKMCLIVKQRNI